MLTQQLMRTQHKY